MSVNIGDGNKIKNSTIAEKVDNSGTETNSRKRFYDKHPVICGLIISFVVGFVLLFSFWENIITWIEGWF
ncbi:MAG: hypothetical protein LIO80_11400 [Lachnospiraceae bacterium]|nr:hypothetical protein [Clostridiales bacterium]MCC8082588.1 hypothetical protein [Lachnospiraceae bacterium]